jgi:histidine ammonia-lyase
MESSKVLGSKKSQQNVCVLGDKELTLQDFANIVRENYQIEISKSANIRIHQARSVVLRHVESDRPFYGINTGVGKNKDRRIPVNEIEAYQRKIIYSHLVGLPPWCTPFETRAVILARLNTALLGYAGISPDVIHRLKDFLNYNILPLIPKQGSIGVCDIGCLSYLGLGVMGEGKAYYMNSVVPVMDALNAEGLQPITLGPKDALGILSSNALSGGLAAYYVEDVRRMLIMADAVYAMSLEGLGANVGALSQQFESLRGYDGVSTSLKRVRLFLKNSDIWEKLDPERVNESLSFRGSCHIHGTTWSKLNKMVEDIKIQLNSSDDNPAVFWETEEILPTANSNPFPWVAQVEALNICLAHVSSVTCARIMQLGDEKMSGLPRFLSPPDANLIAFSTVQKTFASLNAKVQQHAIPFPPNYPPLAGNIEDVATYAPLAVFNLKEIVRTLWSILAIEALHGAQAIDLRQSIRLGDGTQQVYNAIRKKIPKLDQDRPITPDILTAEEILKQLSQKNLLDPLGQKQAPSRKAGKASKEDLFLYEI